MSSTPPTRPNTDADDGGGGRGDGVPDVEMGEADDPFDFDDAVAALDSTAESSKFVPEHLPEHFRDSGSSLAEWAALIDYVVDQVNADGEFDADEICTLRKRLWNDEYYVTKDGSAVYHSSNGGVLGVQDDEVEEAEQYYSLLSEVFDLENRTPTNKSYKKQSQSCISKAKRYQKQKEEELGHKLTLHKALLAENAPLVVCLFFKPFQPEDGGSIDMDGIIAALKKGSDEAHQVMCHIHQGLADMTGTRLGELIPVDKFNDVCINFFVGYHGHMVRDDVSVMWDDLDSLVKDEQDKNLFETNSRLPPHPLWRNIFVRPMAWYSVVHLHHPVPKSLFGPYDHLKISRCTKHFWEHLLFCCCFPWLKGMRLAVGGLYYHARKDLLEVPKEWDVKLPFIDKYIGEASLELTGTKQFLLKVVNVCKTKARETFYTPEIPEPGTLAAEQLEQLSKLKDGSFIFLPAKKLLKDQVPPPPPYDIQSFAHLNANMAGYHLKGSEKTINIVKSPGGSLELSSCGKWLKYVIKMGAWGKQFAMLEAIHKRDGNLKVVVRSYTDPDTDYNLGRWLSNQRVHYKRMMAGETDCRRLCGMTPTRAEKLEPLGAFEGVTEYNPESAPRQTWDESFAMLQAIHVLIGHVNDVDESFVDGDTCHRLGKWLTQQRHYYKKMMAGETDLQKLGGMTKTKAAKLKSLGALEAKPGPKPKPPRPKSKIFVVKAPPGPLGLVLDKTDNSKTIVSGIEQSCPFCDEVEEGDYLENVNHIIDCNKMTLHQIVEAIDKTSKEHSRTLTFSRN